MESESKEKVFFFNLNRALVLTLSTPVLVKCLYQPVLLFLSLASKLGAQKWDVSLSNSKLIHCFSIKNFESYLISSVTSTKFSWSCDFVSFSINWETSKLWGLMALKIFQSKGSDICDLVLFIFTPDGVRGQHFHIPHILNSCSIVQGTFQPPIHLEEGFNQILYGFGNFSFILKISTNTAVLK